MTRNKNKVIPMNVRQQRLARSISITARQINWAAYSKFHFRPQNIPGLLKKIARQYEQMTKLAERRKPVIVPGDTSQSD